jgi:hypothetical protein
LIQTGTIPARNGHNLLLKSDFRAPIRRMVRFMVGAKLANVGVPLLLKWRVMVALAFMVGAKLANVFRCCSSWSTP